VISGIGKKSTLRWTLLSTRDSAPLISVIPSHFWPNRESPECLFTSLGKQHRQLTMAGGVMAPLRAPESEPLRPYPAQQLGVSTGETAQTVMNTNDTLSFLIVRIES